MHKEWHAVLNFFDCTERSVALISALFSPCRENQASSMASSWNALHFTRYIALHSPLPITISSVAPNAIHFSINPTPIQAVRDYQHVDANTVHPPWCITVQASGHTFAPGVEAFIPKLTFDTKNLVFPATVPGCPVYRTAVMKNTGDTPLLFDLSQDPTGYILLST